MPLPATAVRPRHPAKWAALVLAIVLVLAAATVQVLVRRPGDAGSEAVTSPSTPPAPSADTSSATPTLPTALVSEPAISVADPRVECGLTQAPAGFAFGPGGMPIPAFADYSPSDAYNPVSIANFVWAVDRQDAWPRALRDCAALNAGRWLVAGSTTTVTDGVTSRWFPYPFHYSAHPQTRELVPGWRSGLAQGAVLGVLSSLGRRVPSDAEPWYEWAQQVFNSYLVPYADGGFTHEITVDGVAHVWFEEYPSSPEPTSVLNGHDIAVFALHHWWQLTGSPRARELFESGVASVKAVLPLLEVPVEGGAMMTSYDLLRGHGAAPLRLVPVDSATVDRVSLNGAEVELPVGPPSAPAPNVVANSAFDSSRGWRVFGNASIQTGRLTVAPDGEPSGASIVIPGGTFATGDVATLSFRSVASYPASGVGASPLVRILQSCPGSPAERLLDDATHRATDWTPYHRGFVVGDGACDTTITLTTATHEPGTLVRYDDVELRRADAKGPALEPTYDLLVWRTPVNTIGIAGEGQVEVQAYTDGRWQRIGTATLRPGAPAEVVVPERFTGRNLNYKYHQNNHIHEMEELSRVSGDPWFAERSRGWWALGLRRV